MERTVTKFASFEEADDADARRDAAMSPEDRLKIVIELRNRRHPNAAEQRLARVSRVIHSNGVEYLVVGAFAVAFHSFPRYTADLDLLVRPTGENVKQYGRHGRF